MNAATAITKIAEAEAAGVRQIWMNQEYLDTLTIFAAAASKRRRVLEPQLSDLSTSPTGFGPAGVGFERVMLVLKGHSVNDVGN
jgi:hypothetical protein